MTENGEYKATMDRFLNAEGERNKHLPGNDVSAALYAGLLAGRAAAHAFPDNPDVQNQAVIMAMASAAGGQASLFERSAREKREQTAELLRNKKYTDYLDAARDTSKGDYATHR